MPDHGPETLWASKNRWRRQENASFHTLTLQTLREHVSDSGL